MYDNNTAYHGLTHIFVNTLPTTYLLTHIFAKHFEMYNTTHLPWRFDRRQHGHVRNQDVCNYDLRNLRHIITFRLLTQHNNNIILGHILSQTPAQPFPYSRSNNSPEETPDPRRDSKNTGRGCVLLSLMLCFSKAAEV